jgi:thiol reductant ABC exporter CydD subunit
VRPSERRLLRETRRARRALALVAVLAVAATAAVLAQAALLAHVLAGAFTGGQDLAALTAPLVALGAVVVARGALTGGLELAGRRGAIAVVGELRDRLAGRLLSGAPTAAAGERHGELATVAVQGADALEPWFARLLPQALLALLLPVSVIAFLVPRDLPAAAILAVTVPVLFVMLVLVGLAARSSVDARWHALRVLGAHFAEVVRGLPTLRAHRREAVQQATLARAGERLRAETMATLRVAFLSAFVLELGAALGIALVAATVGIQLAGGHLGLEAGLTVLLLAPELYAPIRELGRQHHAGQDAAAAADRLFEVLDRPGLAVPDRPAALPDVATAAITLDGVGVQLPGRGAVLRDVGLRLEPGETVALVGPSGAGKSTLASLLLRLRDPDTGAVRCGGVDLRALDPEAWRAQVAWIPQHPALLRGSVADNVRLARPQATEHDVRHALEEAGLGGLLASLPRGLRTPVGELGRGLSAGQAQRLALARAFLADRPLVILDEPTAHLDDVTAAGVDAAIARLVRGRTALLVVHRPQLARLADRVVTLRDGMLRERRPGGRAVAA